MFVRSYQLDQLKEAISNSAIKVIYGVRRAGKTTLLEQFRTYLRRQGVASQRIIYYDFDHIINLQSKDIRHIFQEIKKELTIGKTNYVFLDELEKLPNYQKLVDWLIRLKTNIDLYVTSSEASIKDLSTQFNCDFIYLGPFSFREFVTFHRYEANLNTLYHYLNTGGFPFAQEIRSHSAAQNYFEDIINSIIINGLTRTDTLCNLRLAMQLATFLARHAGESTNVSQAVAALQNSDVKVSNKTLAYYFAFLQQCFLFTPCPELNPKTGTVKVTNRQYFPVDSCFNWILTNHHSVLSEVNLSAIIFNELRYRGYQVFSNQSGQYPVTFIAQRNGQQHLFQFNFSIRSDSAYQKATAGLRHAPAGCPATLIIAKSGDHLWPSQDNYRTVDLIEWLMEN